MARTELEVEHADGPGGVVRISAVAWTDGRRRSPGYALATRRPGSWSVELVLDDRDVGVDDGAALVGALLDEVASHGGGAVNLWVPRPTARDDELAARAGLTRGRELFQMRRPLPVGTGARAGGEDELPVRPFRPGEDEIAWLEVNNRAFAAHPEQGAWDAATLQAHLAEPWFDPAGFLLHERGGRLAAFCWTKVHAEESPPMGEIFVIAVDPDFHGLGLGRALTLAGLDHLARLGLAIGMLYVDTTNDAALRLYERLGFTVDHLHRAYTTVVGAR